MWRLTNRHDSGGSPLVTSLNDHAGRQVWVFDEGAGTPEERAEADRLREAFTATRHDKKQSADELLRLQQRPQLKVRSPHA